MLQQKKKQKHVISEDMLGHHIKKKINNRMRLQNNSGCLVWQTHNENTCSQKTKYIKSCLNAARLCLSSCI